MAESNSGARHESIYFSPPRRTDNFTGSPPGRSLFAPGRPRARNDPEAQYPSEEFRPVRGGCVRVEDGPARGFESLEALTSSELYPAIEPVHWNVSPRRPGFSDLQSWWGYRILRFRQPQAPCLPQAPPHASVIPQVSLRETFMSLSLADHTKL